MVSEKQTFWQRRWKLIVNLITVAALLVLIFAIRKQLGQTLRDLGRVNAWALLLIIPVELLNYVAQAKIYQGLFKVLGDKLPLKGLIKLSVELNFVNHVFPSGGVTGISYFGVRLRKDGVKAGKATIIQLMKLVLVILSFELLLILGFILMAARGHVNSYVILLCGALSAIMIFGTLGFGYMVGSRRRIDAVFTNISKLLNKLIHIVRRRHPETINITSARGVVNDLHDNYALLQQHREELQAPFWWSLLANLTEVLAVYVVYLAFGHLVNFGAVILAYAVANLAGFVSVLPGGVGVYEGLMTVVLVAGGVPAAISLPVTIMYRVLNTLIQLPPGYYFYHRNLLATATEGAQKIDDD